MKRFSLLATFAALMVFSFGLANAYQGVALDQVSSGLYANDSVALGKTVKFDLRTQNVGGIGAQVISFTNGFRMWTQKNGSYTNNFSPMVYDSAALGWEDLFDITFSLLPFSIDGIGEDTVGIGGVRNKGDGFLVGFDEVTWYLSTDLPAPPTGDGDTLCIDSCWYSPSNPFIFSCAGPVTIAAYWGGPYCYHMYDVPNTEPYWTDTVLDGTADHCVIYEADLTAATTTKTRRAPGRTS
jgi:hypothetical protein